jgi:hypothetical protein
LASLGVSCCRTHNRHDAEGAAMQIAALFYRLSITFWAGGIALVVMM